MRRHRKQATAFFLTAAIVLSYSSFAAFAEEPQTETGQEKTYTTELLSEEPVFEMTDVEKEPDTTPEVSAEETTGEEVMTEVTTEITSEIKAKPASGEQEIAKQTGDVVSLEENVPVQMMQNAAADSTEAESEKEVHYWGDIFSYTNGFESSIVKPGGTITLEARVINFTDFYVDWIFVEGEDLVSLEVDKENSKCAYLTANEDADERKVCIEAHIMHLNEDGSVEEIECINGTPRAWVTIDKKPIKELKLGKDGKLYYYVDNEIDTEFEGIVEGELFFKYYIKNGTVATDMNGLQRIDDALDETTAGDTFYFFARGTVNKIFAGIAEYNGGKFYIKYGTVATDMNGLHLVEDALDETMTGNKFYFFSLGQIQSGYKGLALYDNEWFYLENGYLDTDMNGIVEYDGGKFIVAAGRIAREANGLWQDPKDGKWYFAANGQIQMQHTGIASYDGEMFYIIKGELATNYNGTIKHNGVTYTAVNGQLYKQI